MDLSNAGDGWIMVGTRGLVLSREMDSGDLEFPEVVDLDDPSGPSARIHELLWGSLSSVGFVPDSDVLLVNTDSVRCLLGSGQPYGRRSPLRMSSFGWTLSTLRLLRSRS